MLTWVYWDIGARREERRLTSIRMLIRDVGVEFKIRAGNTAGAKEWTDGLGRAGWDGVGIG
jgi:hypothetical protein